MGRKNTQTMISATEGNAITQFQSKSSHSRFTISAIANPIHSIAKITMAYVLSTRGTVTLQNDEFLIIASQTCKIANPNRYITDLEEDNTLNVQRSTSTMAIINHKLEASYTAIEKHNGGYWLNSPTGRIWRVTVVIYHRLRLEAVVITAA